MSLICNVKSHPSSSCHLSFQRRDPHVRDARLDTLVKNRPHESTILPGHLEHTSIQVWLRNEPSLVHVGSSMDTILDSEWIYQPLTYGMGHNVSTPMSFNIVLENNFKRKNLKTLVLQPSPTLWHKYMPEGSSLRPQAPKVVESWYMLPILVYFEAFLVLQE